MKELFKDLYTRPTFVSIVGMITFFPLLLVILYLLLFVDLGGGGSLGVVLLLIGLLFLIFFDNSRQSFIKSNQSILAFDI